MPEVDFVIGNKEKLDQNFEEEDELEIPAFLRRQKS